MTSLVLIATSPLHLFLTLGLLNGPLRGYRCAVAIVDATPGQPDYLVEALRSDTPTVTVVETFFVLNRHGAARATLARIASFVASHAPDVLATGTEKIEYFAAVQAAPRAQGLYIDDGLYSYLPSRFEAPAWRQAWDNLRHSLKYRMQVDQSALLGSARSIDDAYVLLPAHVHAGLARKRIHRLQPDWFAGEPLRTICRRAAALAGFEAERVRRITLLVLIPKPDLLEHSPALRKGLSWLVSDQYQRGGLVAIKRHPRAKGSGIGIDLPSDAATNLMEIPQRLPVECLAPLLGPGTRVVGALTTGLITLALLGDRLEVATLEVPPPEGDALTARFIDGADAVLRSAGVGRLDGGRLAGGR